MNRLTISPTQSQKDSLPPKASSEESATKELSLANTAGVGLASPRSPKNGPRLSEKEPACHSPSGGETDVKAVAATSSANSPPDCPALMDSDPTTPQPQLEEKGYKSKRPPPIIVLKAPAGPDVLKLA